MTRGKTIWTGEGVRAQGVGGARWARASNASRKLRWNCPTGPSKVVCHRLGPLLSGGVLVRVRLSKLARTSRRAAGRTLNCYFLRLC